MTARESMFIKTVAVEMSNFNDDWNERPAGTGIVIACVVGLLLYLAASWAFGVL